MKKEQKNDNLGTKHTIINSDVMIGLQHIPDKSVHCVVTSPPYWALRDYGVKGQIGLEDTFQEYIQKMTEVFRDVWRVLRDDGTLWLNIGDTYVARPEWNRNSHIHDKQGLYPKRNTRGLKRKNLIGIPWRLAFALQEDGWNLRADIIWHKPNPMPESVSDRPTKSHEYIFLLTKATGYFYDAEAIREKGIVPAGTKAARASRERAETDKVNSRPAEYIKYSGTRNKRSVWTIPTQPRAESHFATFPDELAVNCIQAGTSEYGCCPKCGAPWVRVVHALGGTIGTGSWHDHTKDLQEGTRGPPSSINGYHRVMAGWKPGCNCSENTHRVPCTVLDPFGGSGTVAKVARDLNRSSILIELNPEYVGIAKGILKTNEQLDTGVCRYEILT